LKFEAKSTPAVIENDKPEVDNGGEVNSSPNQDEAVKVTKPHPKALKDPTGIYSSKGRYLGKKLGNGLISLKSPDKEETVVKV